MWFANIILVSLVWSGSKISQGFIASKGKVTVTQVHIVEKGAMMDSRDVEERESVELAVY